MKTMELYRLRDLLKRISGHEINPWVKEAIANVERDMACRQKQAMRRKGLSRDSVLVIREEE